MAVRAIPEGYHSITPSTTIQGADKAIEFYKKAFGAREMVRMPGPDGKVMHCEMQIGDSHFMFGEPTPEYPARPMSLMLYVEDADAVYQRAIEAGAKAKGPMTDQFYGDRSGRVVDPFGNEWIIATHVEDVSPEEMKKRMKKMGMG